MPFKFAFICSTGSTYLLCADEELIFFHEFCEKMSIYMKGTYLRCSKICHRLKFLRTNTNKTKARALKPTRIRVYTCKCLQIQKPLSFV